MGLPAKFPKGTLRNIRIEDEVWQAAKAKAAAEGRDVSSVVREWMARWVKTPPRKGTAA